MQRATSALNRFSAIAASVLVASAIPATAEPDMIELSAVVPSAIKSNKSPTEMPASSTTLAALDFIAGPKEAESNRTAGGLIYSRIYLSTEDAIVGIASFYDDPQQTASGEQYDPNAYTAAAQLEIRHRFGGIRYGRLYQAAYGLGEYRGKKIIVRFNDVGPLRPGRKFDLSRAAMAYFDSTLDKGLLPNFKMTPLPLGRSYPKGPITDEQLAALGIDDDAATNVCEVILDDETPIYTASTMQQKPPAAQTAQPKPQVAPPAITKPAVVAKSIVAKSLVAKSVVAAKSAKKRAAAKAASARRVAKTAPARARAKTTVTAPKAAEQTSSATPWIKRVVTWVASKTSSDQPAQLDKRSVVAQAR